MVEYLKQYLAQWNNFGGASPVILITKTPDKGTIDVSVSDGMQLDDIFGGLPDNWNEAQKTEFLKIRRIINEQGEEQARDYIRNQSQRRTEA